MKYFYFVIILIAVLLTVGCINENKSVTATTSPTPTPQVTTITVTSSSQSTSLTVTPTPIPTKISTSIVTTTIQTPVQITSQPTSSLQNTVSNSNVTNIPTTNPVEVFHENVQQNSNTFMIVGDVIGVKNPNKNNLGYIKFTLAIPNDTTSKIIEGDDKLQVDFYNSTVYNLNTLNHEKYLEKISSDSDIMNVPKWGILQKINANSNNQLDVGEQFIIGVGIPENAIPNQHFFIELRPWIGSAASLDCSVPSTLSNSNKLDCKTS